LQKLLPTDLLSLEQYHKAREKFRSDVMAHKKLRQVEIGAHVTLAFEDRLTMQYQVQEMLRIERIFESDAIAEELAAYNPLIPDGTNLKATMMIEYPDVEERRAALVKLSGIERRVYAQVAGSERVFAIADEDLERATEEKTSAVHFLRLEFGSRERDALKAGAALSLGIDHPEYRASVDPLPQAVRDQLVADLD
jgi:hypothetical protein